MDTPPVPNDLWVCGICESGNVIAIAPNVCPICEHPRDYGIGCCSNPGETTWKTGIFTHQHQPMHPDELHSGPDSQHLALGFSTHGDMVLTAHDAFTESFDDASIYNDCDTDYRDHSRQGSIHGHSGASTIQYATPPDLATCGGAGSQGDGTWTCSSCGQPNSAVHWNQCGACGALN